MFLLLLSKEYVRVIYVKLTNPDYFASAVTQKVWLKVSSVTLSVYSGPRPTLRLFFFRQNKGKSVRRQCFQSAYTPKS